MLSLFHCCCSYACLFIWVINKVSSPVLSRLNSLFSHTERAPYLSISDTCCTSHSNAQKQMQTCRVSLTHKPRKRKHTDIQTHGCVISCCATTEITKIPLLMFVAKRGQRKTLLLLWFLQGATHKDYFSKSDIKVVSNATLHVCLVATNLSNICLHFIHRQSQHTPYCELIFFPWACFWTQNWIARRLKWEAAGAGAQSSWLGCDAKPSYRLSKEMNEEMG